ncbi:general APC amino acid permease, partial [Pisolithus albus]
VAGTVGTALFLGSGQALSGGGPVGALLAYAVVGSVAYASLCSVGEMTSLAPIPGSFAHYGKIFILETLMVDMSAHRWVDEATGFAVSRIFRRDRRMLDPIIVTIPAEVAGAELLISYWNVNPRPYIVLILGVICLVNIFGDRYFGEVEFWFSIVKLTLIAILILISIVIDLGGAPDHRRRGFQYWKDPGPFAAGVSDGYQVMGFMSAVVQSAAAFQGIEIAAIAASEAVSPRRNVAIAMKRVSVRICVFYIAGVFVAGLVVPSNNPQLLQRFGSERYTSILTTKLTLFLAPVVSIINAGVLTSAISAGNSFLFSGSRILYGLALRGQAPACLAKLNTRTGTSIPAVLFTSAFGFLAFLNIKNETFQWFYNMAAVGQLITWSVINFTYLRFYQGMAVQKRRRADLKYWNRLQPWLALWGLFGCIVCIFFGGYPIFLGFQKMDRPFIISYVIPSVFLIVLIGWRHLHQTQMISAAQMDFETNIPSIRDTETPEKVPSGFWAKLVHRLI